ncbi:MBL fold metallo-hydrolase [Desulfitobacterium sp. THU1]|uniref:MBL fold metallo-hydrolase n=1 Tax=Desulfitobacterium sp. THU1 TaxID=3138072 RepID=UPI00311EC6FD
MNNIYDVKGGTGGDSYLIVGDKKTALLECGMAFSAANLIDNIKDVLQGRQLDYVLITHSHYDHVGALPYLKEEWPNLEAMGSEYDLRILERPSALESIRKLSNEAAHMYSGEPIEEYKDELMKIDTVIYEGSCIDLGDTQIKVIETPGHTRCTLSFLIDNEIFYGSESLGVVSQSGRIVPAFIVDYFQAIESIIKCQALKPTVIYSPHYGIIDQELKPDYWQECLDVAEYSRKVVLHYSNLGYTLEEILVEYENVFRSKEYYVEQPLFAFQINSRGMISAILKSQAEKVD